MSAYLVIIPTYNERENIVQMIRAVMALPENFDLLIVDDGSPDGTAQLVKEQQPLFPGRIWITERSGKLGLGMAYLHGFQIGLEKGYTYLFEMDADFSHNPLDLSRLLAACITGGAEVAIGSRYVTGVNVVNWPMSRVLMSYYASVYVRFITGMKIMDSTAGFKCFHRSVLEKILQKKIRFVGYAFQIEMKFRAVRAGFNVVEVPIIFTDRTAGTSKMSGGIIREAFFGVIWLKIMSWFSKAY